DIHTRIIRAHIEKPVIGIGGGDTAEIVPYLEGPRRASAAGLITDDQRVEVERIESDARDRSHERVVQCIDEFDGIRAGTDRAVPRRISSRRDPLLYSDEGIVQINIRGTGVGGFIDQAHIADRIYGQRRAALGASSTADE